MPIERVAVRKAGLGYGVNLQVQAEPTMPLDEAGPSGAVCPRPHGAVWGLAAGRKKAESP